MKYLKSGVILGVMVLASACDNSSSTGAAAPAPHISAEIRGDSIKVNAGPVKAEISNGNVSSLTVGGGNSSVVVGDIQQNQNGVGQTDVVSIASEVPNGDVSADAGDGRSVTMKNGQMIVHREGVGTITLPADQ
jgi:hypothetical protein